MPPPPMPGPGGGPGTPGMPGGPGGPPGMPGMPPGMGGMPGGGMPPFFDPNYQAQMMQAMQAQMQMMQGKDKKKKKDKKEKLVDPTSSRKLKASKREKGKRGLSPSHYALQSPTPYRGITETSATPHEPPKEPSTSVQPSHWLASGQPSATPQPQYPSVSEESHFVATTTAARPKKRAGKAGGAAEGTSDHWLPSRDASPCSSTSGGRDKAAKKKKKRRGRSREGRVELREGEDAEDQPAQDAPEAKKRARGDREPKRRRKSQSPKRKRKRSP
uniref:Uncharacterized protein n=1 Tax=Alexandrium catenella TaxID=2925 RepID=A0A7S1S8M3_ALECA